MLDFCRELLETPFIENDKRQQEINIQKQLRGNHQTKQRTKKQCKVGYKKITLKN